MKVWMLVLLTISFPALASEFTHIKLSPEFEHYITHGETKSNAQKTKSLKAMSANDNSFVPTVQSRVMGALLGTSGSINNPIPVDGEESPLYEEIRRHLDGAHQRLGLEQVENINRINQQFNLGSSNIAGFSWQKPFGVVHVYVDRQVTPNLFGTNWLIMDTFNIYVEATTLLEKLNQEGLSNMSATEIGAFAGVTFSRVYTYYHYANSYQEGLQADFGKLFLSFAKFNQSGMEGLGNEEILKREDNWTASAGGLITTPPLYNISFSGGVLAQYDFQQMTSLQSTHTQDPSAQRYKIGISTKKTTSAGATAELQLDFFKLLKFTLLRFDLNYEYSAGKEFTLGLNSEQWQHVKADAEEAGEFRQILRGLSTVKKLEPYVVRLDESSSSALESRGSILIWGKMQKSKTEQVRVIKDQNVRVFFKSYAQNVKVVQNIFSRIFSAIIYKLLKLPVGASNAAIYGRQLTMEYEATHAQAADPKVTRIDGTEQFSFVLTQYYNANRTDRWVDRHFKNDMIWFVDNFTTLPKDYKTTIRSEQLKGPMRVESNLRVEKAGFDYLLATPDNNLFHQLAVVCDSRKKDEWAREERRRSMLEYSQTGNEACVKDLGLKFLAFRADYQANHLKPSLAKFKSFMTKYYKQAGNIADLQALFGVENTFINGKLEARTSLGTAFNTAFSAGQFRGLGVIDNFKRGTGSRAPASIVSE